MSDGLDGGGEHVGIGGARFSGCCAETIPAGPETEPGPPPGGPLSGFGDYASFVFSRLEAGAIEYGDRSFSAHPPELIREVREELADICGWAYVLDRRMLAVLEALRRLG